MRASIALAFLMLPLVGACASVPAPPITPRAERVPPPITAPDIPPPPPQNVRPTVSGDFMQPQILRMAGLEDVIERDRGTLVRLFGEPWLDVVEGDMRKLQFRGQACVLDVFLYPLGPGEEPVATYVDARRYSDGLDVDRASCIAALRQ